MLASLIKYFAVIVVLPALVLASVLTMVFYGVDSKEETLPTIALLLPGKISDPGWNRSIYLDTEKAFVQSGIAEIAVAQGVSLDNVAQAIDSVRKRDIHAVILGFDKSDKRIEKVIAANTQMRFAGLFKTFDFYGNYLAYVPRWIFPAYMSGFAAASVIWELDSWSLAKQSGVYFLIISVIMLPIAYVTNWMKHTVLGILSYVAIFAAIFVVVWLSQYLLWKRKIKKMNALVSKDE